MIDARALEADAVHTIEDFKQWTRQKIREVLPHECLIVGNGHTHAGGVGLDYVVTVDYPFRYLQSLRNRAGGLDSPLLRRWLAIREPLLFESQEPWSDVPAAWLETFRAHDMRNAVAHGVYDAERCLGTYVCFSRVPGRLSAAHADQAARLAPLMHDTLCRVIEQLNGESLFTTRLAGLSAREREVAHWLTLGKTNGEIASICGLSENTVKHHLTRMFDKLQVDTRAQLVYQLIEAGKRAAPGFGTKIF